jgi:putative oxidoreductase
MESLLEKAYRLLILLGNFCQPLLLFAFRLTWGWQFFNAGNGKLANHERVVSFFASLGIPEPGLNAWFVGGLEFIGGVLLMLGFASRPVALMLTINMIVAYLSVPDERAKVFGIFNDPTPFLSADPFFFLLTSVLVFCFGPGAISVDGFIAKITAGRTEQARHKHGASGSGHSAAAPSDKAKASKDLSDTPGI